MAPDTSGREPAVGTPDPVAQAAVLVGVDGSLNASRAFDIALGIASSRGLDIELVGAFTYPFSYVDPTDPAVADARYQRYVAREVRSCYQPPSAPVHQICPVCVCVLVSALHHKTIVISKLFDV